MSHMRAMITQSSHYFIAYALFMVVGLVSFPVYTRLFSVNEYGLLGLITATVFFVMAFAKLGIQNAIIRFYDEVRTGKMGMSLKEYYSTLTFGPLGVVALASMAYFAVVVMLRGRITEPGAVACFLLSAGYMFFFCSNTIIKNFLRAEQNTGLFNVVSVIAHYASFVLGVGLVYYVFKNITGLFVAFIAVELMLFVYLMCRLFTQQRIGIRFFNAAFFKESLVYGFPLTGMEMTNVILSAGNRYVILFYLNTAAVGLFSAGYSLAMSVVEILVFPLSFAITPLYLRIHAEKGTR